MRKWKDSSILVGLLAFIVMLTTGAAFVERGDKYFLNNVTIKGLTTIHNFLTLAKMPKTTYGNGAGVTAVSTATEYGDGVIHRTSLAIDKVMTITDTANSSGIGSVKIYDFPAGNIQIVGATVNLTASSAGGAAGIAADADGDFALGTAGAGVGATLAGTEADIISSTPLAQFATTTGVIKGYASASSFHDGTSTAKDLYLNIMFDDADSTANDTLSVAGTIIVDWINHGDY